VVRDAQVGEDALGFVQEAAQVHGDRSGMFASCDALRRGGRRIYHCGEIGGMRWWWSWQGWSSFPARTASMKLLQLFAPSEEMLDEEGIGR